MTTCTASRPPQCQVGDAASELSSGGRKRQHRQLVCDLHAAPNPHFSWMALPVLPWACPAGSEVRYNAHHGAQVIDVNATSAEFRFYAATSPEHALIDCYRITKDEGGENTYEDCVSQPF